MPTPTPTSLDTAISESQDALSAMESEAAEYFAERDAARSSEPLNPVAPALERAAPARKPASPATGKPAAPASPPRAPASGPSQPPAKAPSNPEAAATRVPGAPRLRRTDERGEAATDASPSTPKSDEAATGEKSPTTSATPPADKFDDSDIPRAYKPGQMRGVNWDKLHAKADHYEALSTARHQEIENLRAELESLRSASTTTPAPDVAARLDALQKERDSLHTQLTAVAGERIFDQQSKPRREAALAQAKAAVNLADSAKLDSILALPESVARDNALEELLATLSPLRATKLASAVAALDQLTAERAVAASRGSELFQAHLAESTAAEQRAAADRAARAASTFDAELREWERDTGVTPAEVELARSVYTGKNATLADASRAALWGAVGPRVAQQLVAAETRVAELEGELQRLRGAQPGVGAAGSGALPAASSGEEDDPSVVGYAERIAREAARAGVRFGA